MAQGRWINQSQPQTLYIATFLLYFDAAFAVLAILAGDPVAPLVAAGSAAAGYGIANERKWGYGLGVGIAIFGVLPFALALLQGRTGVLFASGISLVFAVAKLALLVHPQSRDYQRIWFR